MRLLVTGGAGYIGSIVGRDLLGAGHKVVVLDNLRQGHREAVPDGAELVEADLLERATVDEVVGRGFDGVLHFAALALVGESVEHPERYWRTNVGGTLNLLEAMIAAGVGRLVVSSTCAVYGEPDEVPISESAPLRPINAYGASKLAVDQMIGHFCTAHGLGALGHNPCVEIYGTDYPTPDGTAIRDYIHIDDLSRAHLLALEAADGGRHRIFNLGNGSGFSVREVIAATERVTGERIPTREAPRRPGDPPMLVAASQRIRSELGWEPHKPELERIIADAWAFARSHPHGYAGSRSAS